MDMLVIGVICLVVSVCVLDDVVDLICCGCINVGVVILLDFEVCR